MRPSRLTRDFTTGMDKVTFRTMFPSLNPEETLEAFFNYHIARGDTSHDWRERFRGFAAYRQDRARTQEKDTKTDSLGLPTDRHQRAQNGAVESGYGQRFLDRLRHHLGEGLNFEQARTAAINDLEGDQQ